MVLANAGIFGQLDTDYLALDTDYLAFDIATESVETSLRILDINIQDVLLTTNLALHYFRKQCKET